MAITVTLTIEEARSTINGDMEIFKKKILQEANRLAVTTQKSTIRAEYAKLVEEIAHDDD